MAREPLIHAAALLRRLALAILHQIAKKLARGARQLTRFRKTCGPFARQVALAIDHQSQIVGRPELGAAREHPERKAALLRFRVIVVSGEIAPVVGERVHARSRRAGHLSKLTARDECVEHGAAKSVYLEYTPTEMK